MNHTDALLFTVKHLLSSSFLTILLILLYYVEPETELEKVNVNQRIKDSNHPNCYYGGNNSTICTPFN